MSFGISPQRPSLLIPSNPAYAPSDQVPRGGILINRLESSEQVPIVSNPYPSQSHVRQVSDPSSSPGTSNSTQSPLDEKSSRAPLLVQTISTSNIANSSSSPIPSPTAVGPHIRFAPLPDPRRPRSLSTGRNLGFKASLSGNGDRQVAWELRGVDPSGKAYPGAGGDSDEAIIDDDDEEDMIGVEANDDNDDERGRKKSWTKMGMSSWKETKKLLTGKPQKDEHEFGAPLKKSISTGGFVGSSPFRWSSEIERKNRMQGLTPAPPAASRRSSAVSPSHRRNSSLDVNGSTAFSSSVPNSSAVFGSSPTIAPVRMLNGRIYGSRRASEAAEQEKKRREAAEPAFVEWGQGQSHGSNKPIAENEDDGSGMAWLRKRREERARAAERERALSLSSSAPSETGSNMPQSTSEGASTSTAGGAASDREPSPKTIPEASEEPTLSSSATSSATSRGQSSPNTPFTPLVNTTELPPLTPAIQVSAASPITTISPKLPNIVGTATSMSQAGINGDSHVVQAIKIIPGPHGHTHHPPSGHGIEVFGDGTEGRERSKDEDEDEEEEEEEEEEDSEQDGDFDDDDDEEDDLGNVRSTASAAGIEVISRHK